MTGRIRPAATSARAWAVNFSWPPGGNWACSMPWTVIPRRPASRYEVAAVLSPAPDVVVTQVRRTALGQDGSPVPPRPPGPDGGGTFSELALYVLVRRDGQWWLAAGQNTLVLPPPGQAG